MVAHTNVDFLKDVKQTDAPTYGHNADGYGRKIPTSTMVHYAGRWRRVYVVCYGNSGSSYIVVDKEDLYIDTDTEYAIRERL
jgi:hypothetical protein